MLGFYISTSWALEIKTYIVIFVFSLEKTKSGSLESWATKLSKEQKNKLKHLSSPTKYYFGEIRAQRC